MAPGCSPSAGVTSFCCEEPLAEGGLEALDGVDRVRIDVLELGEGDGDEAGRVSPDGLAALAEPEERPEEET